MGPGGPFRPGGPVPPGGPAHPILRPARATPRIAAPDRMRPVRDTEPRIRRPRRAQARPGLRARPDWPGHAGAPGYRGQADGDAPFDGGYAKVIRASDHPVRAPGPAARLGRPAEPSRPAETPADVYVYRDPGDQPDGPAPTGLPGDNDAAYWYDLPGSAAGTAAPPQAGEQARGPFEPLVSSSDPPGAGRPDTARADEAPEDAGAGGAPEESAYDRARELEQIKDLYLTAEAISEANVDKHFDQLLAQQRELISDYFRQPGPAGSAAGAQPDGPDGLDDPADQAETAPGARRIPARPPRSSARYPAPRHQAAWRPGDPARGRRRRRRPAPRMVIPDGQTLVIAVLGLGEAGSVIARDLTAAGALVRGYDPAVPAAEPVLDTASEAEAAQEAQLVLSVNSAKAAVEAFKAGLPGLLAGGEPRPDVLWADLNTASPGTKRQLAALTADAGVPFADVAMMAPVPGRGLRVPMLASGPGAARYAALLGPLGAGIEVLDGPAGLAASKKLLRSVFYKGMAASIVEALEAARAAGDEAWLREHIAAELAAAEVATVDRITDGTPQARGAPHRRDGRGRGNAHRTRRAAADGRGQPRPARAPGRRELRPPALKPAAL